MDLLCFSYCKSVSHIPLSPPLEKVYVAIAFAAVMKATLAGELCTAREARCIQLLVSNLVAFSLSSIPHYLLSWSGEIKIS